MAIFGGQKATGLCACRVVVGDFDSIAMISSGNRSPSNCVAIPEEGLAFFTTHC